MTEEKPFAKLSEVWKRVEAAQKRSDGSARLKPREAPESRTIRFAPPCR